MLRLSEVKSSFLNKLISLIKNHFYWFIKSSFCTFNVSIKLLLKFSKLLFMLLEY